MAFHPFRYFRKHQKTLLACVTIMAMFTFVLCSGLGGYGGDFAGWVLSFLGGKSKTPEVAKLYGKKLDTQHLMELRQQRLMANQFMETAASVAAGNVNQDLQRSMDRFGEFKPQVEELQKRLAQSFFGMDPNVRIQVQFLQNRLESAGKKDEAQLLGDLLMAMDFQMKELQRQFDPKQRNQLYFGGGTGLDDLLDFVIWKQQADRLGIQLTDADLKHAIADETMHRLTEEQEKNLSEGISSRGREKKASPQVLYDALKDEFRVRLAQAALIGYEAGMRPFQGNTAAVNQVPAAPTPLEFWDYFRRNLTTYKVALLPVPVKDFVSKDEQPASEKELKDLYERFRDQEYRPDLDRPAFKIPRRIQAEWIAVDSDNAYYQNNARAGTAAAAFGLPLAYRLTLAYDYETNKGLQFQLPPWVETRAGDAPLLGRNRPEPLAVLVGGLAAGGSAGSPLPALINHAATATRLDTRARDALAVTTLVGTGVGPSPWFAAGLDYLNEERQYLPLDKATPYLLNVLRNNLAKALATSALEDFRKELLAKKAVSREAVEEYIAAHTKADAKPVLTHGAMKQPEDKYEIGDDPALKPLKEAYGNSWGDVEGKRFAEQAFFPDRGPATNTFEPDDKHFTRDQEQFVFWKTKDEPARTPKAEEFGKYRDKVLDAWRFMKARGRARQEADKIAAQARDAKAEALKILNEHQYKHLDRGMVIELSDVSRLESKPSPQARGKSYSAYTVSERLIPYPRPNLVEKLCSLSEPGDTVVVSDKPEKTLYVATLLRRAEPTEEEFYRVYQQAGNNMDNLLPQMEQERQQQYREKCLGQLRAEASGGKVDSRGKLVLELDDETRKSFDVRSDSSE